MIPSNPFAAAVNGEIFPLAVFAMMFGLAIARIRREQRQAAVCFFQGVADAMLIIVRWVLVLAPVGIFAVVLPLAARLGFAIVGALAYYVSHANPAHYEPSNITFGIMAPLDRPPRGKKLRNEALSARALADLQAWINDRTSPGVPQVSRA